MPYRFLLLVASSGPGPGESDGDLADRRGGEGDLEGECEAERGIAMQPFCVCIG